MLTLKSFIERHWFLYENRCFECKHRARVERDARPIAKRNIRQYVSNINIRVSLMRSANICILWLYTPDIRAYSFNFSQVTFIWYSKSLGRATLAGIFIINVYYPRFSSLERKVFDQTKKAETKSDFFEILFYIGEPLQSQLQFCNTWNSWFLPLRKYIINILLSTKYCYHPIGIHRMGRRYSFANYLENVASHYIKFVRCGAILKWRTADAFNEEFLLPTSREKKPGKKSRKKRATM